MSDLEKQQLLKESPEKLLTPELLAQTIILKKGRIWISIISGVMGGLIMLIVKIFAIASWTTNVDASVLELKAQQVLTNGTVSQHEKSIINLKGWKAFLEGKTGFYYRESE